MTVYKLNVQCRPGEDSFLRIRPSLISLDLTCVQPPPPLRKKTILFCQESAYTQAI